MTDKNSRKKESFQKFDDNNDDSWKENYQSSLKTQERYQTLTHNDSIRPLKEITNDMNAKKAMQRENEEKLKSKKNCDLPRPIEMNENYRLEAEKKRIVFLKKNIASLLHGFRTQLIKNNHQLNLNKPINVGLFDDLYDILTNIESSLSKTSSGELSTRAFSSESSSCYSPAKFRRCSNEILKLSLESKSAERALHRGNKPIIKEKKGKKIIREDNLEFKSQMKRIREQSDIDLAIWNNTRNQISKNQTGEIMRLRTQIQYQETLIEKLRKQLCDSRKKNERFNSEGPFVCERKNMFHPAYLNFSDISNSQAEFNNNYFSKATPRESIDNYEDFLLKTDCTNNNVLSVDAIDHDSWMASQRKWNISLMASIDKLNQEKTELFKTIERLIWEKKEMGDRELSLRNELFELKSFLRDHQ